MQTETAWIGTKIRQRRSARLAWVVFAATLMLYTTLLWRYIHTVPAVFDEGMHISAGYRYWQCGDYGINPEHPPLVKLVAALPIRGWQLGNFNQACGTKLTSNAELLGDSYRLVNSADGNEVLWKTRTFAMVFPLSLLVTVFLAARMWFGPLAASFAVVLTAFEPNLLGHGPLITTDMALAAFSLLTVAMSWRFLRRPSVGRALLLGVAMGLALASKHSAVLVVAVVAIQFGWEALRLRKAQKDRWRGLALQLLGGWVLAGAVALTLLWGSYGFHYRALPDRQAETFDLAGDLKTAGMAKSLSGRAVVALAHAHALPESYLAGLLYVQTHATRETYFVGRQLEKGVWYYFPVALDIKLTLPVLLLIPITLLTPGVWRRWKRHLVFLGIPLLVFLSAAMASSINIGIRHILMVIPFLIVGVSAGMAYWARRSRLLAWLFGAMLVAHAVSCLRAFPNEIAYANEAWGGQANLYHYLGDSNVDWGQSLYEVGSYVKAHPSGDCWIAWFGMRKPEVEGIRCRPLAAPLFLEATDAELPPLLPERFDGTVLVSVAILDYDIYPYAEFLKRPPDAVVGANTLVFHGSFETPEVAAERRAARGWWYLNHGDGPHAVEELTAAREHAHRPGTVDSLLGWGLAMSGRIEEARAAYLQAAADFGDRPSDKPYKDAALAAAASMTK